MSKKDDEAIADAFADMAMHGRGFTRMTADGIKHIPYGEIMKPIPFTWLRCNLCGWEHLQTAMVNQCADCGADDSLHVISNRDGELPKRLPKHANSCGNQNAIHPAGAYQGVEECGCLNRRKP
jgi:hypothetical protein